MQVLIASEPATPHRPNEDFAAVAPDVAVLLDGAGLPQGVDTGCSHGVAWCSRTLGAALLANIRAGPPGTLRTALAEAISHVRARHEVTCDLGNPNTPAATVTAIRRKADGLEYSRCPTRPSRRTGQATVSLSSSPTTGLSQRVI